MKYPPRCKHGWMSSCLQGCEDAYKPNPVREWEYLVRLRVDGEFVMRVTADSHDIAERMVYDQMRDVLPGWCAIKIEAAEKADPPSMKFFLRNVEREVDDVSS